MTGTGPPLKPDEKPKRGLVLSEDLPLTVFVGVATAVAMSVLDIGAEWSLATVAIAPLVADLVKNYGARRLSKRKLLAGTAILVFFGRIGDAAARPLGRDRDRSPGPSAGPSLPAVFTTALLASAITILALTLPEVARGKALIADRETTFFDFGDKKGTDPDDGEPPEERLVRVRIEKGGDGSGTVRSTPPGIDCGATCSAVYPRGTRVVLTATASPGSAFAGWREGACAGTEQCSLTLDKDVHALARFRRSERTASLSVSTTGGGRGTVTSNPSGITCGFVCTAEFRRGTRIHLVARAAPGSRFAGWSGSQCSGRRACIVVLRQATHETAVFRRTEDETVPLTVELRDDGQGSVVSDPSAIDCRPSCGAEFPRGETVTLTAHAEAGSTFTGWEGGGCSGRQPCTVTLDDPTTVIARFAASEKPTATLVVRPAGSGAGTVTSRPTGILCEPTCEASFHVGTEVTLIAAAAEGSTFTGWKGAHCSRTETCTVTITEQQLVYAVFRRDPQTFRLTVAIAADGGPGTVSSDPTGISCEPSCSASYPEGTTITLTARGMHSGFAGWSGACTGTGSCTVTMDSDQSVTARFDAEIT